MKMADVAAFNNLEELAEMAEGLATALLRRRPLHVALRGE